MQSKFLVFYDNSMTPVQIVSYDLGPQKNWSVATCLKLTDKVEKIFKSTLSSSKKIAWIWSPSVKNSNYWRGSLLELIRQIIAGWCQQTFCFQKIVDNTQQCFDFTFTLPYIIWIFSEGDWIESRLPSKIFSTLWIRIFRKTTDVQK